MNSKRTSLIGSVFFLIVMIGIQTAQAQNPWDTPTGRACFERWISEAMSRLNSYNGSNEFNGRKPWRINQYGILEGNPKYGPTSVRAPDNFGQYNNNRYWYMWDYWHVPSGVWRFPEWNAAGVPHIRNYILRCIAGSQPQPPLTPTDTQARCDQYARTAVAQNGENLRFRCGFTGARWQNDYNAHFQWCLNVAPATADSETRAREDGLRQCRTSKPHPPPTPLDNRARCNQYARTAVAQNGENLRFRCGFTGARWQNDYNAHFQWCLSVAPASADSETRAREDGLRQCRTSKPPTMGKMEWDVDRMGLDYSNFDLPRADPALCQDACARDTKCKAWTYVKPNTIQGPRPRCWLKSGVPSPKKNNCCVSGVKR